MGARVPRRSEGVIRFLLILPIISSVFLPRFAFDYHDRKLSLPLLIIVATIIGLATFGKLRVHVPRLVLFTISIVAMLTSTVLGGAGRSSTMSFLLLALLYFGYIFVIDCAETTFAWTIAAFRKICLIAAFAGIVQFFGQFILPGPQLFTFRGYIPDKYLILNFNYVIPLDVLPGRYKSNGFFLPEPSIFGQLMALAAISEVLFFRPTYRLIVIFLALFLSYSGTGAILCLVFIPLLLLRRGNPFLLLAAALLTVVFLVFAGGRLLEPFGGRIGELSSTATGSSGFARFISPFYLINDVILTSVPNILFGLGPGAIDAFFLNFYVSVHDPTWGKLFFEYGFVGTLPFAIFVTCCFVADAPSRWLSGALFLNWLVLGGYLLSAPMAGLVLPLAVWHRAPAQSFPKRRTELHGFLSPPASRLPGD
jgi:hypothetical protein